MAEQTRRALRSVEAVLKADGMTLEQVVSTTVYLADLDDFTRFNAAYAEFLRSSVPPPLPPGPPSRWRVCRGTPRSRSPQALCVETRDRNDMIMDKKASPDDAGVSRRGFVGLLGAGAASVGIGAVGVSQAAGAPLAGTTSATLPPAMSPRYRDAVERLFVLDKDVLFMNVDTVGSPPREVLDTVARTRREVAVGALAGYSAFDDIRALVARGYGCDPDEVALTHNTSDAMSKIIAGLALKEGDKVLITNHEHPSSTTSLTQARDRHGIVVKQVGLPVGNDQRAEDYVELCRRGITWRTKAMLAKLAQDHGLISIVDSAHVPGMMAYSFHELGIDFLAGSMAKWQCAP